MTDAAEPLEKDPSGTSRRNPADKRRSGQVTLAVLAVLVIPVVVVVVLAAWTLRHFEPTVGPILVLVGLVVALVLSVGVGLRVARKIRAHIDAVHRDADRAAEREALRVEAEQKGMREAYSSVFVNLSRRSQGLVQRQLTLIEQLERDEEDADRLAVLFQLDHLATRMRRNNENLVMLSGAEPARRGGKPVSAGDVLRAAVSEIEQYQRVVVQTPPSAHIAGHAASDIMRLLAELIENATAFSPPGSRVVMSSKQAPGGGLLIDVVDSGIGMTADELADANARMTKASSMEMVTSKRMGLFVVGRLASKHKVDVRLVGRSDGGKGLRASVVLPAELVVKPVADLGRRGGSAGSDERSRSGATAGAASGTALFASGASGTAAKAETGSGVQYRRPKKGNAAASADTGQSGTSGDRDNLPAGKDLFKPEIAPLSDWWKSEQGKAQSVPGQRSGTPDDREQSTAASGAGAQMQPEQTPIFDQLSAWFSERPAAPQDAESEASHAAAPKTEDKPKTAEADESKPKPSPTPRETGDAAKVAEADAASKPKPSPTPRKTGDAAKKAQAEPKQAEPKAKEFKYADAKTPEPEPAAKPTDVKPAAEKKSDAKRADAKPATEKPEQADKSWESATDSQWREVAKVTEQAKPAKLTEAGLPKRDRGARLLPGKAANADKPQPKQQPAEQGVPNRNADAIRSRLSGFQRGVKRGKYDAKRPTETNGTKPAQTTPQATTPSAKAQPQTPETKPADAKPATPAPKTSDATASTKADKPALPQRKKPDLPQRKKSTDKAAGDQKKGVVLPQPRQSESMPNESSDPWEFSSAAAWEEAKAVADARPQQFTDKGLPKRNRGERLMPGGVTKAAAGRKPSQTQAAPRPNRDPNVVRNRLAGFQQGVRRGKQNATEPKSDTGASEGPGRTEVSGSNKEGA